MKFIVALLAIFVVAFPCLAWAKTAQDGKVCLSTARGERSYVRAVCGKDTGSDTEQYHCVFPDKTSETCFKSGECFVCEGDD